MGLKDYTDTKNGPQLAVLKHAVIGDRIGEVKIEKVTMRAYVQTGIGVRNVQRHSETRICRKTGRTER